MNYGDVIKVKTGSRIPIWRTFICQNGSSYNAAVNGDMSTKSGFVTDFDLLKAVTSTNTKPEIVLSGCVRHLEKSI